MTFCKCKFAMKKFMKKKDEHSRLDLLRYIYLKGQERVRKEFAIERVIKTLREVKTSLQLHGMLNEKIR